MIENSFKTANMEYVNSESCPSPSADDDILNWNIPDSSGRSMEAIRKIRDQIDETMQSLIVLLDEEYDGGVGN